MYADHGDSEPRLLASAPIFLPDAKNLGHEPVAGGFPEVLGPPLPRLENGTDINACIHTGVANGPFCQSHD